MLGESHDEGYIEEFAHELLTGVLDFGERDASFGDGAARRGRRSCAARPPSAEVERTMVEQRPLARPGGRTTDIDSTSSASSTPRTSCRSAPTSTTSRCRCAWCAACWSCRRDRSLEDLLLSMRSARVHFAVVVDGERRTAGVVTLEDLLEELVGDILDESDRDREPWSQPARLGAPACATAAPCALGADDRADHVSADVTAEPSRDRHPNSTDGTDEHRRDGRAALATFLDGELDAAGRTRSASWSASRVARRARRSPSSRRATRRRGRPRRWCCSGSGARRSCANASMPARPSCSAPPAAAGVAVARWWRRTDDPDGARVRRSS